MIPEAEKNRDIRQRRRKAPADTHLPSDALERFLFRDGILDEICNLHHRAIVDLDSRLRASSQISSRACEYHTSHIEPCWPLRLSPFLSRLLSHLSTRLAS